MKNACSVNSRRTNANLSAAGINTGADQPGVIQRHNLNRAKCGNKNNLVNIGKMLVE